MRGTVDERVQGVVEIQKAVVARAGVMMDLHGGRACPSPYLIGSGCSSGFGSAMPAVRQGGSCVKKVGACLGHFVDERLTKDIMKSSTLVLQTFLRTRPPEKLFRNFKSDVLFRGDLRRTLVWLSESLCGRLYGLP